MNLLTEIDNPIFLQTLLWSSIVAISIAVLAGYVAYIVSKHMIEKLDK